VVIVYTNHNFGITLLLDHFAHTLVEIILALGWNKEPF